MGPILHSAPLTLYTGTCTIPILHPTHIGIFPQPAQVLNLGSELALRGRFSENRRRVPAQTFPGAILQFQKTIAPQTRKNRV